MVNIYRIKISVGKNFDDSFYFDNLPTAQDVVKVLKENREACFPEYNSEYNKAIAAAEIFSWPETMSGILRGIGTPMPWVFGQLASDDYRVYVNIDKCQVRKSSREDSQQGEI